MRKHIETPTRVSRDNFLARLPPKRLNVIVRLSDGRNLEKVSAAPAIDTLEEACLHVSLEHDFYAVCQLKQYMSMP